MFKWPIILFILLTTFSCGKNKDEEIEDLILNANIELSRGNCQTAIDTLEDYGRQNTNIKYLKALASSYACRAEYSSTSFFSTDLSLTATPAPLGGTSTYSTSLATFQNPLEYDPYFADLQTAITILLYAGNIASTTEPTAAERAKFFASGDLGDLNSELMYLELAQLGRFFKVYGNASAAGAKGAGTFGNLCLTDYPTVTAGTTGIAAALAALPGACKVVGNIGHPQLRSSVTAADRKRRMCQGVVLLNGFFDVLPSVIASATGSLNAVGAAAQVAVTAAKAILVAGHSTIGIVKTTVNQKLCEDNTLVPVVDIESYYAIMMESMIQ